MDRIIDTHAHLDDAQFAADLPEVLARARAAGVGELLTMGIDPAASRAAVALAGKHAGVWAAVGLSPHEAKQWAPEVLPELERLAARERVVAIGEIGLDFRPHLAPPETQRAAFRAQLALADRLNLPVCLHVRREEHAAVLEELKAEAARRGRPVAGLVHCFTAGPEIAARYDALGFGLAFGGIATFPNAPAARAALAAVPDKRLFFETDCPYLAPQSKRGQRCEPADIREVLELAAKLRKVSFADAARVGAANARRLFRLPEPDGAPRVLVYPIREALYVNLTNACTNRCTFCDRGQEWYVKGHVLRYAEREPTVPEFTAALADELAAGKYREVVFCGYGEPTLELAKLVELARWAKARGLRTRVNTNGTGNLYHRRDILPDLKGALDVLAVSLNTADPAEYRERCRPTLGAGDESFRAVQAFVRAAVAAGFQTVCSAVAFPEIDLAAVERLARSLGADFRVRQPVPG